MFGRCQTNAQSPIRVEVHQPMGVGRIGWAGQNEYLGHHKVVELV